MIERCKFCKRFVEAKTYMRDPIVSPEGKKIVNRRNEMQFDTIAKCLNRVEEIIETETVIETE